MAEPFLKTGRFQIVGFDEDGVRGEPQHRRLVCLVESDGKLAIWGKDGARTNIDAVLKAGVPCTVECQYRPPGEAQAERFGHRYWVREDCRLTVLTPVATGLVEPPKESTQTEMPASAATSLTVAAFFESKVDKDGRAQLAPGVWIELRSASYVLVSSSGSQILDPTRLVKVRPHAPTAAAVPPAPVTSAAEDDDEDWDDDESYDEGEGEGDDDGGYPAMGDDDAEADDYEDSEGPD